MEKLRRQVYSWLMLLIVCALLTVPAAAGDYSLTVRLADDDKQPYEGIAVEICHVAAADGVLLPEFSDAGVSLGGTAAEDVAAAKQLYRYVLDNALPGSEKTSNSRGDAVFSALSGGFYLVFERGGQKVTFLPYLVALSDESGIHVISEPKLSESGNKKLSVTKVWQDGGNAALQRPGFVRVRLLRDGKAIRTVQLSAANGWQHVFTALPDTGSYSVEELAVTGYTASYQTTAEGFVITNTFRSSPDLPDDPTPERGQLTVSKVWDDADNAALLRPSSITVQLILDKTVVQTAILNEANGWQHVFTGLDRSKLYQVREITVPNYTADYADNGAGGIIITNTYSEEPDTPGMDPDAPSIPQTGTYTYHIYLMFLLGAALIVLGVRDLRREGKGHE